jgi:hypothetical protein
MKAADLATANAIIAGLQKVNTERHALESSKAHSAGIRIANNEQTWIALPSEAVKPLVRKVLDEREAELRRRAAQIGLSL